LEFDEHSDQQSGKHHEQFAGVQAEFKKDVCELTAIINGMGNPFLDDGEDLVTLDTKLVTDSSVVKTLQRVETLGQEQYDAFVQERLVLCENH
jgi:hypothetical protein